MLMILAGIGCLLLFSGLGICLINYGIALHNALRGTHTSPVPLMGTIFMVAGLYLAAPRAEDVSQGLLFAALFFDLSGLPALCLLPFALLFQKKSADAPPPAQLFQSMVYAAMEGAATGRHKQTADTLVAPRTWRRKCGENEPTTPASAKQADFVVQ